MSASPAFRSGVLLAVPALLLVGFLYGAPLVRLAAISLGEQQSSLAAYRDLFGPWAYTDILLRTFRISATVTLGCLLFGYPIAYVLAFATPRRRALLSILLLLPLWTSILVRNFAWIYLLRDGGTLSTIAGVLTLQNGPARLLYNETGVVIGMTGTLLPFMVLPLYVAIASHGRTLNEAAASLGATPARMFVSITLPLSIHGILAGSMLVFASGLGFFISPALLGGGRVLMAAPFIDQQVKEFVNWPLAAAAGIVLFAGVAVTVLLYRSVVRAKWPGIDDARG